MLVPHHISPALRAPASLPLEPSSPRLTNSLLLCPLRPRDGERSRTCDMCHSMLKARYQATHGPISPPATQGEEVVSPLPSSPAKEGARRKNSNAKTRTS